ncbi:MAG: type II 3-dehydroquinate dehydratase [Gammaproteobacteria bacterium]
MAQILVLHGPNLNLLGEREPEIYGSTTLDEINQRLQEAGQAGGNELAFYQSNAEHDLIDRIHLAKKEDIDFIIINPGAFTHTSIALRDALLGVKIPFIEVHLSNVFSRDEFRRHSYLSDIAVGIISGLGPLGYELAMQAAVNHLRK